MLNPKDETKAETAEKISFASPPPHPCLPPACFSLLKSTFSGLGCHSSSDIEFLPTGRQAGICAAVLRAYACPCFFLVCFFLRFNPSFLVSPPLPRKEPENGLTEVVREWGYRGGLACRKKCVYVRTGVLSHPLGGGGGREEGPNDFFPSLSPSLPFSVCLYQSE